MKKVIIALLALVPLAATADLLPGSPFTVEVSKTKYSDGTGNASARESWVQFVGDPFDAECGRNIKIVPMQVGRITGPLDDSVANGTPVIVWINDETPNAQGGCNLQVVING